MATYVHILNQFVQIIVSVCRAHTNIDFHKVRCEDGIMTVVAEFTSMNASSDHHIYVFDCSCCDVHSNKYCFGR